MPGYVLHVCAQVSCFHQLGLAKAASVQPQVKLMGSPVIIVGALPVTPGCPFMNGTNPQPCTTITWPNVSTRVKSFGQGFLLKTPPAGGTETTATSMAGAIPQGLPTVKLLQTKVIAQ
jgi:hypothetical protein